MWVCINLKFDKNEDLNDIEEKYGKTDYYIKIFPFLSKEVVERYLPLMFTFVIMEDMAEKDDS